MLAWPSLWGFRAPAHSYIVARLGISNAAVEMHLGIHRWAMSHTRCVRPRLVTCSRDRVVFNSSTLVGSPTGCSQLQVHIGRKGSRLHTLIFVNASPALREGKGVFLWAELWWRQLAGDTESCMRRLQKKARGTYVEASRGACGVGRRGNVGHGLCEGWDGVNVEPLQCLFPERPHHTVCSFSANHPTSPRATCRQLLQGRYGGDSRGPTKRFAQF